MLSSNWAKADVDNDGTLSLAELQVAAPSLTTKFQDMDTNRDGKLTRDELRAYQTSHPGSMSSSSSGMDADQSKTTSSSSSSSSTPSSSSSSMPSSTSTTDDTTGTSTAPDNTSGTTGQ